MSQLLESRWSETKEALLEGLQGNKRSVMATTLENTRKYLAESATAGATSAGNVATLNRVILPVIRRVMPTVIANELVGVQPMTGPVGQIHTLRVRYADSFTANGSGTSVAQGDEALSPFKIAEGYSGTTNSSGLGQANTTATLEGTAGNRLSIQILKQTVEAKTRKLSARWTFEAAQDAQAQQGIDIEAEIMAALAQEITAEIDQEIIASLNSLAGTVLTYDQASVSGTATFVGDEHAALAVQINRVANLIAQRTRRGAGNWAVVSPTALTLLQSATTSAFARTTEGTFEAPTNTKFVGTLNSAMRVYVNGYATSDDVLIGYKGSSESDAAAFYCPYIPLMSSGVVLDPSTFEPVVSFMTRYGYLTLTNTASSLGNAADYVGKVAVTTANLKFA
jgi:Major capsid protein Gp23